MRSVQAQDTGGRGKREEKRGREGGESRADLVSEIDLSISRLSSLASAELSEVLGL